jgi:hypothetical protein
MKGGVQLFKDRISPQAKNGYRNRIPNIDTISNDEFQILMKSIHYEKGTLKSTLQFPTMTRSETYVRELCDTYHDSFSNKYFSDTMQTSNLTDEAVAKAFITGIGYAPLRYRLAASHPTTFADAAAKFYENLDDFDTHHNVQIYVDAVKRSHVASQISSG